MADHHKCEHCGKDADVHVVEWVSGERKWTQYLCVQCDLEEINALTDNDQSCE